MERACRALRFAVRCVGARCAGLLPPLAAALGALYAAQQHSCVLYLASVLLDELAGAAAPALVALLQDLMPRAFALLQQPNGLQDNPDTVDDLFRLCIRYAIWDPFFFRSYLFVNFENKNLVSSYVDDKNQWCILFLIIT